MRKVFAIVAALIGGYLLWSGFKIGRVLLIMKDSSIDSTLTIMAVVLAGLGVAFLALGWWLFRDLGKTPPPPTTPPTP